MKNFISVMLAFALFPTLWSVSGPAYGGINLNAAADPVKTVEVSASTVWRDAVSTGSVTVTCVDSSGNPVPNTSVSVSITSPGKIVGSSSGTTDSNGDFTVTVISTDLSPDSESATVTATSGNASGTRLVTFMGALRITEGGDITEKTSSCNVGEPQAVTATILSGVQITSATWSAGGATPIGGWSPGTASTTTPFPPDNKSEPTTTLYLTTTGSDTLTLTASDSGATGSATTTFTVSEPSFQFTAIQNKTDVQFNPPVPPSTAYLEDGGDTNPKTNKPLDGIDFTESGGSSGSLALAQILTSVTRQINNKSVQVAGTFPGIDNGYPYNGVEDTPGWEATVQGQIDEMSETFNATMYLMWTSSKAGSIPIPVMSIVWYWKGDFNFDTEKWNTDSPSADGKPLQGTPVTMGVLTWTGTVKNVG